MVVGTDSRLTASSSVAIELDSAELRYGDRRLWSGLSLSVERGEFIAVLGPNGSGKTSLIKVLLGLRPLTSGTVRLGGEPPRRGSSRVGYVPQQRGFDSDLGARGIDLVALGFDGHRYGVPWPNPTKRRLLNEVIEQVGASRFAYSPIGLLSGGEQQRLRIAQALLSSPQVLLCDEPLLSLDLANQKAIVDLIDERRRASNTAVVFVTHEINPILPVVDRIVYIVDGRWAIGTPEEVMTSERLSDLYQTRVEVTRIGDKLLVVGATDASASFGLQANEHHE
ncbi:MAG: zinc/manganese transport system ATP-binding protein [Microbacteriaceae bacterium]|jgi:zinc/manganese transport system ATP-binding protein|nr:ATPase component of Mn/Zn ABC-type transporter [Microbacteriaceae bacterium]MDQ1548406.1 zinc/manganese transport system ATP-binding protein [Microbacteriaceae bacterium]MDQ1553692.1 zinc/manganese transport system ATP-binding protein [Microbacteriaceae bacterium]